MKVESDASESTLIVTSNLDCCKFSKFSGESMRNAGDIAHYFNVLIEFESSPCSVTPFSTFNSVAQFRKRDKNSVKRKMSESSDI